MLQQALRLKPDAVGVVVVGVEVVRGYGGYVDCRSYYGGYPYYGYGYPYRRGWGWRPRIGIGLGFW